MPEAGWGAAEGGEGATAGAGMRRVALAPMPLHPTVTMAFDSVSMNRCGLRGTPLLQLIQNIQKPTALHHRGEQHSAAQAQAAQVRATSAVAESQNAAQTLDLPAAEAGPLDGGGVGPGVDVAGVSVGGGAGGGQHRRLGSGAVSAEQLSCIRACVAEAGRR